MLAYVVTALYIPFPRLHLLNFIDRVVFTLRWLMVSLLAIYAGVIAVGNKRFGTAAINPLDPSGKQFTELRQQYLQNTVEQFLLHSFSLLALSTYLSEEKMHWIPLLIVLFIIARALFFIGYSIDPLKRGVGFASTWYPTMTVTGYCLYCMCVYGACRHLIPSTKLTSSSPKTFHFSYMKFLDEMFIKVKVSSIFKEKNNSG